MRSLELNLLQMWKETFCFRWLLTSFVMSLNFKGLVLNEGKSKSTLVPNFMSKPNLWYEEWQNHLHSCVKFNAKFWQCHSWCQIWHQRQLLNLLHHPNHLIYIARWDGFNLKIWFWDCAKMAPNRSCSIAILFLFLFLTFLHCNSLYIYKYLSKEKWYI